MRIIRNQTISVFDISKQKRKIKLTDYGSQSDCLPQTLHLCLTDTCYSKMEKVKIKKSCYNYFLKKEGCSLLWNTASDACILLSNEETRVYEAGCDRVSSDFESLLYEMGFLVDADLDEVFRIDLLRKKHAYAYPENGHIDIEILPTQTCNARCFYCFEQNYRCLTMSREIIDQTVSYLCTHISKDQNVTFIWFGGEPLMGASIIDEILRRVNDYFKGELQYNSAINTNNSLISEEILRKFTGLWRVNDVLTTIDGYSAEHDRRKAYLANDFNAYRATLSNIQKLLELGIQTTCRLNLDKQNFDQLDSILDDLQQFCDQPNFHIQATTLRNQKDGQLNNDRYFFASEYPAFYQEVMPKLLKRGFIKDPLSLLPKRDSSNCIACALNKVVINSNGRLFRCVQDSLSDDNSVGDCINGLRSNYNYTKWYREMDNLGPKCEGCIYLPCCQGGCKHYRLSPSPDTTPCFRKKFYVQIAAEELIKLHAPEV